MERPAKNSAFAEGMGPGLWYSFNYERLVIDDLGVRAGFSYMSISLSAGGTSTSSYALTFPITASYIGVGSGSHSLEVGAGASIMYAGGSASGLGVSTEGSGVAGFGIVQLGYRIQPPDGGFQFRVGFAGFFGPGLGFSATDPGKWGFFPWGYISFGGTWGWGDSDEKSTGAGDANETETVETAEAVETTAPAPTETPVVEPERTERVAVSPDPVESNELPAEIPDEMPDEIPGEEDLGEAVDILPEGLDPRADADDRIVAGESKRDEVLDRFGMPKDMAEQGEGMLFVYREAASIPGCRSVKFNFDANGVLKHMDIFPEGEFTKAQVMATWGKAPVRKTSSGHSVLVYAKYGMFVYMSRTGDKVNSIRMKEPKKR